MCPFNAFVFSQFKQFKLSYNLLVSRDEHFHQMLLHYCVNNNATCHAMKDKGITTPSVSGSGSGSVTGNGSGNGSVRLDPIEIHCDAW